jgi:hypothetical protein
MYRRLLNPLYVQASLGRPLGRLERARLGRPELRLLSGLLRLYYLLITLKKYVKEIVAHTDVVCVSKMDFCVSADLNLMVLMTVLRWVWI